MSTPPPDYGYPVREALRVAKKLPENSPQRLWLDENAQRWKDEHGATPSSRDSMLLAAELLQRAAWADIIE